MGLHKRHTHGRVFHGEAAREQLRIRKRDSHGNNIIMHVPEGFEEQQKQVDNKAADAETAYSVVYVTLSQTFSGPAVYSTLTGDLNADATPTSSADAKSTDASDAEASYAAAKSAAQAGNKATSSSTATVVPQSTTNAAAMTTLATASSSVAATVLGGTPIQQASRSATATSTSQAIEQTSNSGMSGGAKAGLAIGIILAIGLALGLIFFCWRRKKNEKSNEEALNEKHGSFADVGARGVEARGGKRDSSMTEKVPASLRSTRTTSTAPRLSLRPVTQFLPNLGEQRKSTGNNLDVAAAGATNERKSAWERTPSNGAQNPFADATVLSEKQARPDSPPQNPFDEPERKSNDSQERAAAAAGAATAAAAVASANGSKHSQKGSWEGSEPATPRSATFGTAAAVPVAGPNGGPRQPNNVHRVQLDFKPSMDDELELKSGQLVRLLHEYDDGWALCIRMDRSQQGVAPRTCLSKLPVKPRPQGPPPNGRPGPPPQGARRPSNPPPPNGMPGAMYPRPLTPTQSNRAPSPTEVANGKASTSPDGVPARKPVPGQAM